MAAGRPRHPVTIALSARHGLAPGALLRSLITGAELDVARFTYADWTELERYCEHAAGSVQLAIVAALAAPSEPSAGERQFARRLGSALRQTEMLRDAADDVRGGRLYAPSAALAAAGLDASVTPDPRDPRFVQLLDAWRSRVRPEVRALARML